MLVGIQVANLLETALCGQVLREQRSRVVTASLCRTGSTGACAVVVLLNPNGHARLSARLEVGADRGADDVEVNLVGGAHAKEGLRRKSKGTQVERGSFSTRNPLLICTHVVDERAHEVLAVHLRHGQTPIRVVHTRGIEAGTECPNTAVGVTVGLDTFEGRLAVVKDSCCRRQVKRTKGNDLALAPSGFGRPPHVRHVIGEDCSEVQFLHGLFVIRLRSRIRVLGQRETTSQFICRRQRLLPQSLQFGGSVLRFCHRVLLKS